YFPNDPQASESNLLFETLDEDENDNGVLDPGEDRDFDGHLDTPNTLGGVPADGAVPGYDDLLTFYERSSNTLILRPVLPLHERRRYAVVVTRRLRGADAAPVR